MSEAPISTLAHLLARQPGPVGAQPSGALLPALARPMRRASKFRPGLRVTLGSGTGPEQRGIAVLSPDTPDRVLAD